MGALKRTPAEIPPPPPTPRPTDPGRDSRRGVAPPIVVAALDPGVRSLVALEEWPAPSYLDQATRDVWDRLAAVVALTERDVDMFAVLCTSIVHHRQAVALVSQSSVLIVDAGGHPARNPAMIVVETTAARIASLSPKFGLTPADRGELIPAPATGSLIRPKRRD